MSLTPQTAIVSPYNDPKSSYNLLSHILSILKYHSYIPREKRMLNIDILIGNLINLKRRQKQMSLATTNKREANKKAGVMRHLTFYI